MFRNVIVAGTFNILHSGHKTLLATALSSGRRVTVGVTSDSFAKQRKKRIRSFSKRRSEVEKFLGKEAKRADVVELHDKYGTSITSDSADAIAVSSETEPVAQEINGIRKKRGLEPLHIISVPIRYAQDFKKISCSRILGGEIDPQGKRKRKVVFALGSLSPDKLDGSRTAISGFFRNFSIVRTEVKSGVGGLPFGQATLSGATNRAKRAFSGKKCDFGIGLESGVFRFGGSYYVSMWCSIFDGEEAFLGSSMAFAIPESIVIRAHEGKLREALSSLKAKQGIIHALSNGLLTRRQMAEQACSCAMLRLANRGLFDTLRKHL